VAVLKRMRSFFRLSVVVSAAAFASSFFGDAGGTIASARAGMFLPTGAFDPIPPGPWARLPAEQCLKPRRTVF